MKLSTKILGYSFLLLLSACGNTSELNQPLLNELPAQNIQPETAPEDTATIQSTHSIRSLVIDILYKYDHNKNGQLDYRDTNTFLKNLIHRNENHRYSNSFSTRDGKSSLTTTTYTMEKLFFASDVNHDGFTTPDEITKFIKTTYDKNNDELLDSRGWKFWKKPDEFQIYTKEVGEIIKSVTSVNTGSNNTGNTPPNTTKPVNPPVTQPVPPSTQPGPTIVVTTP